MVLNLSVAGAVRQVRLPDRVAWDDRLGDTFDRVLAGHPVPAEAAPLAPGVDGLAVNVLEHEVGRAVLGAAAVDELGDAGMLQPRGDAALGVEAPAEFCALQRQRQQLERGDPLEGAVGALDAIHSAHAAGTDALGNAPRTDAPAVPVRVFVALAILAEVGQQVVERPEVVVAEAVHRPRGGQCTGVRRRVHPTSRGKDILYSCLEALLIEGLQQIIDCIFLERFDGVLVVGGAENYKRVMGDLVKHIEAGHAGHLNIEKNKVRLGFLYHFYSLKSIGAFCNQFYKRVFVEI